MEDLEDAQYDAPLPEPCPMCRGSGLFMGTLGTKDWYRCRNCGMEFSVDESG